VNAKEKAQEYGTVLQYPEYGMANFKCEGQKL